MRFRYDENQLKLAIDEIRSGGISQNAASKKYGIPKSTINTKIRNIVPMERKMGPPPTLSESEEKRLEDWIIAKAKLGFPMHHDEVQLAVQNILKANGRENPFRDDKPGKKWLRLFLKRRPSIVKRNTEIISKARAAVTEDTIRDWFQNLTEYLRTENLENIVSDPTRIYNADETGMQFCPKTGKLLGPKHYKDFYVISSGPEKESMTVLCNFAASGLIVPPMIIVPYKRIPRDVAFSIPDSYFIGRSDSGWMVSETFYEYITNCFHPWLLENKIQLPVVLFLDGHKSHINVELFEFCVQNSIVLYCLPPNATHIIQPCDVSIFKSLKTAWKQVVQQHKQMTNKYITKATFAPLFKKAFDQAINEKIIKNGFRCCGLFPLDPDAVNYQKTLSFRRNEIFGDQHNGHEEPTLHDLQATLKVLDYYFSDQIRDKNSEIYAVYRKCKDESPTEMNNTDPNIIDAMPLTESLIDEMPLQFDDMILFTENTAHLGNLSLDTRNSDIENINGDVLFQENNDFNSKTSMPTMSTVAICESATNFENLEENKHSDRILTEIADIINPSATTTDLGEDKQTIYSLEEKYPSARSDDFDNSHTSLKLTGHADHGEKSFEDKSLETDSYTVSNNCDIKENRTSCSSLVTDTNDPLQDSIATNTNTQDAGGKITILSDIRLAPTPSNRPSIDTIWKKHLHWPKIEEKVSNKKVKDIMPFALTSKEWKAHYDAKERNKVEVIALKERRKQDRKRKAEEKNAQPKKRQKLIKSKDNCNTSVPKGIHSETFKYSEDNNIQDVESETEYKLNDFVIVRYDNKYFPGNVLNKEGTEYEVTTMVECAAGKTWKWPEPPDIVWYKEADVMAKITEPKKINSRGFFTVNEINKFINII